MRIGDRDCTSRLTPMSDGTLQCLQCGWSVGPSQPNERQTKMREPGHQDSELTSLRAERDALKLKVEEIEARLLDPVAVHANMLRGTIAMPSLTNFLHAMGSHALTCIRETVKIAKRNEQSVYIDQAEHLLSIVKGSDLREADAAIKEAGKL